MAAATSGKPPPSSNMSWIAAVLQADPNYQQSKREQPAYIMANGRVFLQKYPDPYSTP